MTEVEKVAYLKDGKKVRKTVCHWLELPLRHVKEVSALRYDGRDGKDYVDFSLYLACGQYVKWTVGFSRLTDSFFAH